MRPESLIGLCGMALVLGLTLLSLLLNLPLISGLYGTMVPLVIALVVKELPLAVQLLRTSVSQVSTELEEAADVSGADFPDFFFVMTPCDRSSP